ncbi:deoxyribonuclease IV [Nocardioides pocheonensis]|uniref:Probable endonuclease 4 n=1 Tax=Nocardioides pocheonensis TaxID=661485 RepID=A0A3N0GUT8_9ACTN|nr:deoxyribonuclease IV [Nocardioides pocheonensis]RNM15936.1 deoxyribonuclease IV [Nocardioides pocheonensis]
MPSAITRPVGSHVFVGKGLVAGALRTAEEIGAEAVQVFVGNPRGWALSEGDPAVDEEFARTCADRGVRAFVHTPYLVNLGSPTPATYERSVASIAHNLARAARLGAEGVVVHTGSCVEDGAVDAALRQVREGLLPVLDRLPDDGPWLLLEPTAGQGRSLCGGVEDLGPYLDVLDRHPRVGICLDTCHVFAAGAPLDEPGGATRTLDRLVEIAGADRLRLVHANDSKDPRGSLRDRHERIGEGRIGEDAFVELLAHAATEGVPFVAETPGSGDGGVPGTCVPLLKKLRDR